MYCRNCGKEITSKDNTCPYCGYVDDGRVEVEKVVYVEKPVVVPQPQPVQTTYIAYPNASNRTENRTWGTLAIIFGLIVPFLGFIFAIKGLINYKDRYDPYHNGNVAKSVFGLIFSLLVPTIILIIYLAI